jgi:hypothetical protein
MTWPRTTTPGCDGDWPRSSAAARRRDARLDAESDTFDALRALESKLEQTVPALGSRRAASEAKLAPAEAEMGDLRARFTGPALAAVAGNADQALGTAALRHHRPRPRRHRARGRSAAARRPRRAGRRTGARQAEELLAAVGKVGTDLRAAADAVPSLLAEVDADLAAGRAAAGAPGTPGPVAANLAGAMAATEQAAASTRAALAASTMDPLAELPAPARRRRRPRPGARRHPGRGRTGRPRRRHAGPGDPRRPGRDLGRRRLREHPPRRGRGTGPHLLAEAQRHLDKAVALAQSDPVTALAEAQQADQMAEQATRAAHSDVDQWSSPADRAGSPARPAAGAVSDGLAGAILGGILIGGARGRGLRRGRVRWWFRWVVSVAAASVAADSGAVGASFGGHSAGGFGGRRGGGGRF